MAERLPWKGFNMNRRSFLASMAVVDGSLVLRHSVFGQATAPVTQSTSAVVQSDAIRAAADQFLKTLGTERQNKVVFAFPKGCLHRSARRTARIRCDRRCDGPFSTRLQRQAAR